jgi:hypothetical protein
MLEGLSAIVVASRDDDFVPACTLASAVHADGEGRATVYVPEVNGGPVFANVERSGAVAVVMEHIPTHRCVQIKGTCLEMRPAREDERPLIEAIQQAFFADVRVFGASSHVMRRNRWPCRAITFTVAEVFEQTPGPRAGLPVERPS